MKSLAVASICATGLLCAMSAAAQDPAQEPSRRAPDFMMLAGRGAEIGVQVSDAKDGGVVVDEVVRDGPGEKAGLKKADVLVEFDGERVRSTRQFARLVQETPPGRTVKVAILRGGRRQDVEITPREGRAALPDFGALRGLPAPPPTFEFHLDPFQTLASRRLGVTIDPLTDQLAEYFGAKSGVLVAAVADGSAASAAGVKAGDVITTIDGRDVRSREEVLRALRDAPDDEVRLGVVRDRKAISLTAKLERPSSRRTLRD